MKTVKRYPSALNGKTLFTNKTYSKTRKFLLFESMSGQSIYFMVSGSFLAGYLKYLGVSDSISAILMQLPLLGAIAQLFSPLAYERLHFRLPLVRSTYLAYRGLLATLGMIPLFCHSVGSRIAAFSIIMGVAFSFSMFADGGYIEFLTNVVPNRMRKLFLSKREASQILAGTFVIIIMSKVLDIFKDLNAEKYGFYVFYAILFLLFLANVYCFYQFKEPAVLYKRAQVKLKDVFSLPLKNKKYRKFIIYFVLYYLTWTLSYSFNSIYMVSNLNLNYTYIAAMVLVCNFVRAISARLWGMVPSRFDATTCLGVGVSLLGVTYLSWSLITVNNYVILLPVTQALMGISFAGIYTNMMQVNMHFAPREQRTVYFSFNSCAGFCVGFLSSVLGAALAVAVKDVRIDLGFISFEYLQIVFLISAIGLGLTGFYVFKVLGGEIKKEQESI